MAVESMYHYQVQIFPLLVAVRMYCIAFNWHQWWISMQTIHYLDFFFEFIIVKISFVSEKICIV